MHNNCNHCPDRQTAVRPKMGIASWLLLALLPKCPFCIMAFTSTAMLCGEGVVTTSSLTHNSPLTITITAALGMLTLLAIVFNRRGVKTIYALLFSIPGLFMIMFSVIRQGGQPLYYSGTLLLFVGVWMNGSLPWLWKNMFPGGGRLGFQRIYKYLNGSAQVSGETRRN